MNHATATTKIMELIAQTNSPASLSTEDMILEIKRRLDPGVAVRITDKAVTVSHSKYRNNLRTGAEIKAALELNEWVKCDA